MLRAEVESSFPASVAKRMVASSLLVEMDMVDTRTLHRIVGKYKLIEKSKDGKPRPKWRRCWSTRSGYSSAPSASSARVSAAFLPCTELDGEKSVRERRAIYQRCCSSERIIPAEGKGGAECLASKLAQKLVSSTHGTEMEVRGKVMAQKMERYFRYCTTLV